MGYDVYGIIYMATNKATGKSYIGKTNRTRLRVRRAEHLRDAKNRLSCAFHSALVEYGAKNFVWKVLKQCFSEEELSKMEIYYIKQFNTLKPNGYNSLC
jgi:group I intron endonuclease